MTSLRSLRISGLLVSTFKAGTSIRSDHSVDPAQPCLIVPSPTCLPPGPRPNHGPAAAGYVKSSITAQYARKCVLRINSSNPAILYMLPTWGCDSMGCPKAHTPYAKERASAGPSWLGRWGGLSWDLLHVRCCSRKQAYHDRWLRIRKRRCSCPAGVLSRAELVCAQEQTCRSMLHFFSCNSKDKVGNSRKRMV
jgi:hypothetical protein